jgi:hypothetical protein
MLMYSEAPVPVLETTVSPTTEKATLTPEAMPEEMLVTGGRVLR